MNTANTILEIPGYRILRRLGRGGMATVYLASQESLSRLVAIKVLASGRLPDEDMVHRFENEARTIARLDHPHIVNIFDVGRTGSGQIYYTMPYLPNGDLAGRSMRDDPQRILQIIRALAEALGSAHDLGVVHRDVKPENVLFDALDRPLLADFGIALSGGSDLPRVTREGATIGSSGYMSPEQARGQATDGRSDLYSLGVVCYELLTGEMPFSGSDALAVALAHIEKPIPRLPVTRRAWQPLIDRALAKQPDARFQSAEELLAALDVVGKRMQAPPPIGPARWWRSALERIVAVPRRWRTLALCACLLLAFAGLLAVLPRVPERAAPAPLPLPSTARPADDDASHAAAGEPAEDPAAAADSAALARRLREAGALFARGHLVSPGSDNAAERYLAILADAPGQPDAVAGVRRILDSLANDAARSITAGDGGAATAPTTQGITLAGRAKLLSGKPFTAFVAPIHDAIGTRLAGLAGPLDFAALADLKPFLPTLARIDSAQTGELRTGFDKLSALLRGDGHFQDPDGPLMSVVPAGRLDRAIAIAAAPTSRGEYARFATASARPASRCRESQRLFARSKGLDWRNPGSTRNDDQAVVCTSWNDAAAYAQWLSRRSGAHYRLPTRQEWPLLAPAAAVAGGIGLWIADCAKPAGKAGACGEREFRGLRVRERDGRYGPERSDTGDSDTGYANVGFRLVREIPAGAAHP